MPTDVCYGREETVLSQKDRIKLNTITTMLMQLPYFKSLSDELNLWSGGC
jgi:hypothetical protein